MPERVKMILEVLDDRQCVKDVGVANRRAALGTEIKDTADKLTRPHRAMKAGVDERHAPLRS